MSNAVLSKLVVLALFFNIQSAELPQTDSKAELNRQLMANVQKTVAETIAPTVTINATSQQEGGFFLLRFTNLLADDKLVIEHNIFSDTENKVYYQNGTAYAVIPLDYHTIPGKYPLTVKLQRMGKSFPLFQQTLSVTGREYEMQHLQVNQSTVDSTRSDEAYAEYHKKFMPVRLKSDNQQYWEGRFIQPVEGHQTTDYGAKRKVNGSLTSYRHNGVDFGAATGTPIYASNHGKVAFAEKLKLTGNTIVIDHGLGFFTYYLHCDQLFAKQGERVIKGQKIATVGTTGFSTGPHLHFTASYHLKNINPYKIMEWNGDWQN